MMILEIEPQGNLAVLAEDQLMGCLELHQYLEEQELLAKEIMAELNLVPMVQVRVAVEPELQAQTELVLDLEGQAVMVLLHHIHELQ
jgi:hypothetical protein